MDPTAFSSTDHSGEMRELLTRSGSTCPPTVISSLRQLQCVTEGGVARRRHRKTHLTLQRDVSSVYETTRNSSNVIDDWDTSSSAWDINNAASRGHQVLLPFAMQRVARKFDVIETENSPVKDGTWEGSQSFLRLLEKDIMEENPDAPIQSAARRRRIGSDLVEASVENGTEKGGGKAFTLVEAPTRAPSQKSVAGRDALPHMNCIVDSWQNVSRANGYMSETEDKLELEVSRGCKKPVLCAEEDVRDGLEKLGTASFYTPGAGVDGADTRREFFCTASKGRARRPEPAEIEKSVTCVHKQTVVKNLSLRRESSWCGNDGGATIYHWNLSRSEKHTSHENLGTVDQRNGKVPHPIGAEKRGSAKSEVLPAGDEVLSEDISTALNHRLEKAKGRQHHFSPQRDRGQKQNQKVHCDDDELLSVEACYEQEKTKAALTRLEDQPHRDNDGGMSNRDALDYRSLPVLASFGKQPEEACFLRPLSRERVVRSRGRKLDTTGKCRENDWIREQDMSTRTAPNPSEDTRPTLACGKDRAEEKGAERLSERLDRDAEDDSENRTSTALSETCTEQENCLTNAFGENGETPEERNDQTSAALSLSSPNGDKGRTGSLAMDTTNPLRTEEGACRLSSKDFGRPGFILEAPPSMSLYYHVQEASPRPRKRFPMHNAAETTQQPNRLYPVVKGVSRDNAKRRWAVYWKGSRRYFYDKLNENCYHAYQQAVNFRKYSYIQHASRGKNFSVTKVAPGYKRERSPPNHFGSRNIDAASTAKTGPTYSYAIAAAPLNGIVPPSSHLSRESETALQNSRLTVSTPIKDTPAVTSSSHPQISDGDAQVIVERKTCSYTERTNQSATRGSVELADGGPAGGGLSRNLLQREELPADPVMNMYKTALLMVLQDLKASLTGLSASPAPPRASSDADSSSKSVQGCGDGAQSASSSTPSRYLENRSTNDRIAHSTQNPDPQNAERELRLRPFLLLVVEWHLDTVKLASHRRDLQPLLGVFSPCFQQLLLPRDAPRLLQHKIYRGLMEIHTMQVLSHLTNS